MEHYAFEQLGEGLYAGVARHDGWGICNTGLIDTGDGGLVFDTSTTARSAHEIRAAATRFLGRAPTGAVNSHWHFDHSLGNRAFEDLPIWGTRRTREFLLETREALMAELTPAALEKGVGELEARRAAAPSRDARNDVEFMLRYVRALHSEAGSHRIAPPDRTFETRHTFPGSRGAELLSFGRGHTESDAVLYLPREKVLFTGDLAVVGQQPSMGSGDAAHWLVVLDEIGRLGPERIVPGHGPVSPAEALGETREYVEAILAAVERPGGSPLPAGLRRWEGSVTLEENLNAPGSRTAARDRSA
ncbi:MAG: MBL fold metallo-hydrolase [Thermoplasmata archaeon]|nr:MBL fold metallo-hydrolase [Thermoplasmata archaeon]